MSYTRELLKGSTDSLLLCLISEEPMYGYRSIGAELTPTTDRSAGFFASPFILVTPDLLASPGGGCYNTNRAGDSSSGRTADSGSACPGSNPGSPAKCFMAHSSRGLGRRPLKAEITGSNPVCATLCLQKLADHKQTGVSGAANIACTSKPSKPVCLR